MGDGYAVVGGGLRGLGRGLYPQTRNTTTSFRQRTYVIPASHPRHSRVGGNLDAVCAPRVWGHRPRVLTASVSLSAVLLRLPRGAGAEDSGACGDEEAAGKEEHEQQAA